MFQHIIKSHRRKKSNIASGTFKKNSKKNVSKEEKCQHQMKLFHNSLQRKIFQCTICFEAWPLKITSKKSGKNYICTRCIRDKGSPKKYSIENNMIPSLVPAELQGLSQCEEMLIAHAFPVMQVYLKPRYGTVSYKGHVVTLPHNVQKIADILPHCPTELPVVIFSIYERL